MQTCLPMGRDLDPRRQEKMVNFINSPNVKEKIKIMFLGMLVIFMITLGMMALFVVPFRSKPFAGTLWFTLILNTIWFSLGGLWVWWRIKTPSWLDGVIFGIFCFIIFNLLPFVFLHMQTPFKKEMISWFFSTFVSSSLCVFAGGCLFRKLIK